MKAFQSPLRPELVKFLVLINSWTFLDGTSISTIKKFILDVNSIISKCTIMIIYTIYITLISSMFLSPAENINFIDNWLTKQYIIVDFNGKQDSHTLLWYSLMTKKEIFEISAKWGYTAYLSRRGWTWN